MAKKKPRPAFDQISIEIFAVAKSCDQGCPPCPLANKGTPVTATVVDTEVQQTFSILESALKDANARYDLHLSSTFDLIPVLNHPDLIHMARFTTNRSIRLEGNTQKFADDIKNTLAKYKINPKIIGYSIVPTSPVVSEVEINLIREINQAISAWYFKSQHREIQVTIRSNLIKSALYDEVLPKVFAADTTLVKSLVEEFTKDVEHACSVKDQPDGHYYSSRFKGAKKNRTITLNNRVITGKKLPDTLKASIDQMYSLFPFSPYDIQDYAIAPQGVMFVHSSLAIHNKIMWVSHKDFRDSLAEEIKGGKKFSSLRFIRKMMTENDIMARIFTREVKAAGNTGPIDFMTGYQNCRLVLRNTLAKKKK